MAEVCGAWITKRQKHCELPAGYRTEHHGFGQCYRHGGRTPNGTKSALRTMAQSEVDRRLGHPLDVDKDDALIMLVKLKAGDVEFYRQRVEELEDDEMIEVAETRRGVDRGEDTDMTETKARPHPWLELYNEAQRDLEHFCMSVAKAGVAERKIALAERQAREMFTALSLAFSELGLRDRFDAFRAVFAVAIERVQAGDVLEVAARSRGSDDEPMADGSDPVGDGQAG